MAIPITNPDNEAFGSRRAFYEDGAKHAEYEYANVAAGSGRMAGIDAAMVYRAAAEWLAVVAEQITTGPADAPDSPAVWSPNLLMATRHARVAAYRAGLGDTAVGPIIAAAWFAIGDLFGPTQDVEEHHHHGPAASPEDFTHPGADPALIANFLTTASGCLEARAAVLEAQAEHQQARASHAAADPQGQAR